MQRMLSSKCNCVNAISWNQEDDFCHLHSKSSAFQVFNFVWFSLSLGKRCVRKAKTAQQIVQKGYIDDLFIWLNSSSAIWFWNFFFETNILNTFDYPSDVGETFLRRIVSTHPPCLWWLLSDNRLAHHLKYNRSVWSTNWYQFNRHKSINWNQPNYFHKMHKSFYNNYYEIHSKGRNMPFELFLARKYIYS